MEKKENKKVQVGSVWLKRFERGGHALNLRLGNKSDNPKYQVNAEIKLTDGFGNPIDGYLNLVEPNEQIDGLLANGFIDESEAEKRKSNLHEDLAFKVLLTLK